MMADNKSFHKNMVGSSTTAKLYIPGTINTDYIPTLAYTIDFFFDIKKYMLNSKLTVFSFNFHQLFSADPPMNSNLIL